MELTQFSSGLGNGSVPNRRQAITLTNGDPVHWHIYTFFAKPTIIYYQLDLSGKNKKFFLKNGSEMSSAKQPFINTLGFKRNHTYFEEDIFSHILPKEQ